MKIVFIIALSGAALVLSACSGPVRSESRDALWIPPGSSERQVRVTSNLAGYIIPRPAEQAMERKFQQANIMLQTKDYKSAELSIEGLARDDCSITIDADTTIVGCQGAKIAIPDISGNSIDTNRVMDALNMSMKQTAG